ncbi:type II toxin-antitoxin system RelE/ParE family toxin [Sphingomonas sp. SUN039]|uniref:type II toxin-antitoxin system RelE/ParE family toxin n=1 Tax=Sphingomonas sp. SUN039 TaxID=2937787 RepID=UPI0021644CE1|nr:type II toxin-antitoxin system RelE/ParE family toxin [Sphingomonas sp. SUN039]UVO55075.1 type II toxin-antitoxin system RelE/ParE family toxin [Sphingomonas sp. SUN039]
MAFDVDAMTNVLYEGHKFRVAQTAAFSEWLPLLRDRRALAKITDRLLRAADGNFGDVKSAGSGISEMRIDYGPGYRVYFCQRGTEIVILLCGGGKRTQQRDIANAKRLKAEIEFSDGTSPL